MAQTWTTKKLASGRIAVLGSERGDKYLFDQIGGVWSEIRRQDGSTLCAWTVNEKLYAEKLAALVTKHNEIVERNAAEKAAPTISQPAPRRARRSFTGSGQCDDCDDGLCCGQCACCGPIDEDEQDTLMPSAPAEPTPAPTNWVAVTDDGRRIAFEMPAEADGTTARSFAAWSIGTIEHCTITSVERVR